MKDKFTDEDLKRFKREAESDRYFGSDTLSALIARLEAAEAIVADSNPHDSHACHRNTLFTVWRQASGK